MNEEIKYIKNLTKEAKHSHRISVSMLGESTSANKLLLKWVDVSDSIIDYLEDKSDDNYQKIIIDLSLMVYMPVLIIADSFLVIAQEKDEDNPKVEEIKSKLNKMLFEEIDDPIDIKKQILEYINELAPLIKMENVR